MQKLISQKQENEIQPPKSDLKNRLIEEMVTFIYRRFPTCYRLVSVFLFKFLSYASSFNFFFLDSLMDCCNLILE